MQSQSQSLRYPRDLPLRVFLSCLRLLASSSASCFAAAAAASSAATRSSSCRLSSASRAFSACSSPILRSTKPLTKVCASDFFIASKGRSRRTVACWLSSFFMLSWYQRSDCGVESLPPRLPPYRAYRRSRSETDSFRWMDPALFGRRAFLRPPPFPPPPPAFLLLLLPASSPAALVSGGGAVSDVASSSAMPTLYGSLGSMNLAWPSRREQGKPAGEKERNRRPATASKLVLVGRVWWWNRMCVWGGLGVW